MASTMTASVSSTPSGPTPRDAAPRRAASRPAATATVIAATLLVPATAAAAGPRQASVAVAVDLGEGDDAIVADRLKGTAAEALQGEGITIADDASHRVQIKVAWDADDNHAITVQVTEQGSAPKTVEGSPFTCEACNENQLVSKLAEAAAQAAPLIGDGGEAEPTPAGDGGDTGETGDAGETGDRDRDRGKAMGAMGGVGIGVLAVGVGGLGAGIALALREDKVRGDVGEIEQSNTKPLGFGLIGGGAALMVTGAVLIAIDVVRHKKQRTSLLPVMSPRMAGVVLTRKF